MRTRKSAMTLVELLVVIAIIGVLVSLLLPAVSAARAAARATTCKNHQRQIGLATLQYCDVHDGHFPEIVHAGMQLSWVYTLEPYLESVDAIRICPDDPLRAGRLTTKSTSYIINGYLTTDNEGAVRKLQKLHATTRTMVQFEGADNRPVGIEDEEYEHAHAFDWFSPLNVQDGLVLWAIQRELQLDRHQGGSHYLFADAHVDLIPESQIVDWVDESFEFARPQ